MSWWYLYAKYQTHDCHMRYILFLLLLSVSCSQTVRGHFSVSQSEFFMKTQSLTNSNIKSFVKEKTPTTAKKKSKNKNKQELREPKGSDITKTMMFLLQYNGFSLLYHCDVIGCRIGK